MFDDAGVMVSTVWAEAERLRMLYIGWNRGASVPFRNAIGLASSTDGGETFTREFRGPVVDRSIWDPSFVASPFVLVEVDGYRLWYLSCTEWFSAGDSLMHRYHIKSATSKDAILWHRRGEVAIDFLDESEYAIARPWVVRTSAGLRMWFCARGESYRVQSAFSSDGIRWTRDEHVSLDVSPTGWDSEMTAYPAVFDWRGMRYLLYNGNGYGRTGIGLAVLEDIGSAE